MVSRLGKDRWQWAMARHGSWLGLSRKDGDVVEVEAKEEGSGVGDGGEMVVCWWTGGRQGVAGSLSHLQFSTKQTNRKIIKSNKYKIKTKHQLNNNTNK